MAVFSTFFLSSPPASMAALMSWANIALAELRHVEQTPDGAGRRP